MDPQESGVGLGHRLGGRQILPGPLNARVPLDAVLGAGDGCVTGHGVQGLDRRQPAPANITGATQPGPGTCTALTTPGTALSAAITATRPANIRDDFQRFPTTASSSLPMTPRHLFA